MDREYHAAAAPSKDQRDDEPKLEEPIVPLRQLGTTVATRLPGGGDIIQNTEAAIRSGMPNIQFTFTQGGSPFGGAPKGYGKEVREAIRSMAKVNEVLIEGVELPSGQVNLTGFNQQNFTFSEQKRQTDLNEVRDYIKFTADVAGGGGVDIWSAEFPRTVFDARWNRTDPKTGHPVFQLFEGEGEQGTKFLVDQRNGKVIQEIRMNQKVPFPVWLKSERDYTDENGNQVRKGDFIDYEDHLVILEKRVPVFNKEEKRFEVRERSWKDFQDEADLWNAQKVKEKGRPLEEHEIVRPEEAFFKATVTSQLSIAKGYELLYSQNIEEEIKGIEDLKKAKTYFVEAEKNAKNDEERMLLMKEVHQHVERYAPGILPRQFKKSSEIIDEGIRELRRSIEQHQNLSAGQRATAEEQERILKNVTPLDDYAKKKLFDSYAQAGIFAMQETQMNKNAERPIYVGPEIGWPTFWGGHPKEFKELIFKSRDKMAEMLSRPVLEDGKPNPYYAGMDAKTAQKKAAEHIKGCFDTSHMGMWINNFRRIPGESEEKRLQEFNKWYLEQVEDLAKDKIIGSIQAVDSMTGEHEHLPPGQGIFPIAEAVKIFKKYGFDGPVLSEGHAEEQFGQQRIFMQAMKYFGTTMTSPYSGGRGMTSVPYKWGGIRNAYFGRTYTPFFIVGAYSPSNDFKLWSDVPFE